MILKILGILSFFLFKVCYIDPGNFKDVESLVNSETKGKATIEVQSFKVRAEGEEKW